MNSIIHKLQKYNYKFNDAIKNIKSQDYKKYSQHQIKYMTQLLKSIKSTQRGGADLIAMTDTLNKFESAVDSAYKQQKTKASDAKIVSDAADEAAAKALIEKASVEAERDAALADKARLDGEKTAAVNEKTAAEAQLAATQADKLRLEADKLRLESEKTTAENEKAVAVGKIAATEAEKDAANANKDTANAALAVSEAEKVTALAKITTLEGELIAAKEQHTKANADLTVAKEEVSNLKTQITDTTRTSLENGMGRDEAKKQIVQLQSELKVAQERAAAATAGVHVAGEEINDIYKNYYKLAMLYIRNFVKTAKNLNLTIDAIVTNGVVDNSILKTQFDLNDNELTYVIGTGTEVLEVDDNLRGKLNPAAVAAPAVVEPVTVPAAAPVPAVVEEVAPVPAVVEEVAGPGAAVVEEVAVPAVAPTVPQDFKDVVNSDVRAKNVLQMAIENKKNVPIEYEKYLLGKIKRARADTPTNRIGSRYTELKPTRNTEATKDEMIGWANSSPQLLTVEHVNALTGGSLNDEKYREKYLKYKAKYMELKSKMH